MKFKKWPRWLKVGLTCMGVYLLIMTAAFLFVQMSIPFPPKPAIYDLPDYIWSVWAFFLFPTMPWMGLLTEGFKFPHTDWLIIIAHFLNGLVFFTIGAGVVVERNK